MNRKQIVLIAEKFWEPFFHAKLHLVSPPYSELQNMNIHILNFAKKHCNPHTLVELSLLKTLDSKKLYSLLHPLGYITIIYHFPAEQGDDVLILDSFLPEPPTDDFVKRIAQQCGFNIQSIPMLTLYYSEFPIIDEGLALQCMQNLLHQCGVDIRGNIYRECLFASPYISTISPTSKYEILLEKSELIQTARNALFHSLSQGDMKQTMIYLHQYQRLALTTSNQTIDGLRNWLIELNAQCEYALSCALPKIHPFYLSAIQAQNMTSINSCHNIEHLKKLSTNIVDHFCRLATASQGLANCSALTANIIAYIDQHLHEQITLQNIAEKYQKNKSYLSALFKRETGLTITQYTNIRRLEEAAWLLRSSNMPIQQVSENTGYNDVSYFDKLFYKQYHLTPIQYRKLNNSKV